MAATRQARAAVNSEGKKLFKILHEKPVVTPDVKEREAVKASGGKPKGSQLASAQAQTELHRECCAGFAVKGVLPTGAGGVSLVRVRRGSAGFGRGQF